MKEEMLLCVRTLRDGEDTPRSAGRNSLTVTSTGSARLGLPYHPACGK
jgi:hypothetical protein